MIYNDYGNNDDNDNNATTIYQYMAVLTMVEKQRAKLTGDNDIQKLFIFQDMVHNIEGKAKDDENLVPVRISQAMKREKEKQNKGKEKGKEDESEKEKLMEDKERADESPLLLPAIMQQLPPANANV